MTTAPTARMHAERWSSLSPRLSVEVAEQAVLHLIWLQRLPELVPMIDVASTGFAIFDWAVAVTVPELAVAGLVRRLLTQLDDLVRQTRSRCRQR